MKRAVSRGHHPLSSPARSRATNQRPKEVPAINSRMDGDDLILAGTATQGVRVDAAGNARDVLLDASILGDAIRRRRLLEAAAAASK